VAGLQARHGQAKAPAPRGAGAFACALFAILLAIPLHAAIWPEQFGEFKRISVKPIAVSDAPLFDEYGLAAAEQAQYKSPKSQFTGSIWRLKDSTGALGVFQMIRPADAVPSKFAALAVTSPKGLLFVFGNYVFLFDGYTPTPDQLQEFYSILPRMETAPLPVLSTYLPPEHLVPNSERYILGPVSLDHFDRSVPPSVAAFHLGTEAQLGRYRSAKGDFDLAIFNYPTPQMARERAAEFGKLSGAVVKRAGPLVAIIIAPPDADAAERILARVDYKVSITLDAKPLPKGATDVGSLLVNIFALAGVILAICLGGGIAVGGLRVIRGRLTKTVPEDPMVLLRLGDK
jgi:hypothetical protein